MAETHTALELSTDQAVVWAAEHPSWFIFPGRMVSDGSGGWIKRPLVRWTEKASVDPDDIRAMWDEAGGRAVVCVACAPSGIWVLDEDRDPGKEWASILEMVKASEMTLVLKSCTKGRPHFFFRQPPGMPVAEGRWDGGDVKATGIVFISSEDPVVATDVGYAPEALLAKLSRRPLGTSGRGIASIEDTANWRAATPDPDWIVLPEATQADFIKRVVERLRANVDDGAHRREACLRAVYSAALEASAGCYPAEMAYEELREAYGELREDSGLGRNIEPGKGWTSKRKLDYDLMWASLVPNFAAGDHDEAIDALRADVIDRYGGFDEDDFADLEEWLRTIGSDGSEALAESMAEAPREPSSAERTSTIEDTEAPGSVAVAATDDDADAPKIHSAPELHEDALWGPHGEFIEAAQPFTECTTVGLLATAIAISGVWHSGRAHFVRERCMHGPNVFICGVGQSSLARKSSSWTVMKDVFFDPHAAGLPMLKPRVESGVSSGERLKRLWAPEKSSEGVEWPEPRVLWRESEATHVWKLIHREGATMRETVCQAWDQDDLAHMTVTSGDAVVPASKYWLGILTYTTVEAMRQEFHRADATSGFGNRFLWMFLPDSDVDLAMPDAIPIGHIERYRSELGLRAGLSGSGVEVEFSSDAEALWREVYPSVKHDKGQGSVEGMLSRAETYVLRLALNYHLVAGGAITPRECISVDALRAALAVWRYCKDSTTYVFSDTTGDARVDNLVAHLESEGGWERWDALKRWRPGDVDQYLKLALKYGVVIEGGRKSITGGRGSKIYLVRSWVDEHRLIKKDDEILSWKGGGYA